LDPTPVTSENADPPPPTTKTLSLPPLVPDGFLKLLKFFL